MTPIEGESAIIALAICAVTPWLLFGLRVWKVSTATKAKKAQQAGAETAAAAKTEPLRGIDAA